MRLMIQLRQKPNTIQFHKDIVAGVIVALVSIPISMGYALLAGLPVVYGLYGSLLPVLVFGLLTTSPQFVVGVDAMPAVMVGGLLAQLSIAGESPDALRIVPLISLLVACWFLVFYVIKAGRIVKYISTPVMGGFISGVGLTIILMQVPKLFGGKPGTGELFELLAHIYEEMTSFHLLSFLLGLGTVLIILICKRIIPKIPMTVIMLFAGALLQGVFHLDQYGVALLAEVEGGMPKLQFPDISYLGKYTTELLLESAGITVVIMAQSLLATGRYAQKYGDKVDNNKELLAYAGMNMAGALVGCCPINGSVSRSGIADGFGCRSQVMSISAALTMLFVLLFGTPYLKYLPVPILTGIVMTALVGILETKLMRRLWKTSRDEWLIFILSFAGVLIFGTVNGVVIGCVLSFAHVAIRATTPPVSFVGRIPGQGNFYALDRNKNARPIKHTIIFRFSGNLFFANIDKMINSIEYAIKDDTKCVIIDARAIGNIDITAVDRMIAFSHALEKRGIRFFLTEHDGRLNDQIRNLGGEAFIEEGKARRTITLALRDMGIEKPYELEERTDLVIGTKAEKENADNEPDEMLAEMEWAFGAEAEERLDRMAMETLEHIEEVLTEERVHTSWGLLGRFDESEFWDHLEMRLEQMAESGKFDPETLNSLEKRIESRRILGEEHLREMNPHALELLKKHREKIRENLKQQNPHAYEHIRKQQIHYYEQLKKRNPQLAEKLAKLHEEKEG